MIASEIKEALAMKGISIASIARRYDCTPPNVHQLFVHAPVKSGKPSLIRKFIADQIGKSFDEVWH